MLHFPRFELQILVDLGIAVFESAISATLHDFCLMKPFFMALFKILLDYCNLVASGPIAAKHVISYL